MHPSIGFDSNHFWKTKPNNPDAGINGEGVFLKMASTDDSKLLHLLSTAIANYFICFLLLIANYFICYLLLQQTTSSAIYS